MDNTYYFKIHGKYNLIIIDFHDDTEICDAKANTFNCTYSDSEV